MELSEMAEPQFGGPWTEEKLSRLRKYLAAYMAIFSNNPRAKLLKTIYVDAFAGTGFRREIPAEASEGDLLFDVSSDSDAEALRKGSAQVALETIPSFSEYIFIEHNEEHAENLSDLRRRFPNIARRIKIIPEVANVYLLKWSRETDWNKMRAVVFLDPYGMQVEWATIEAMAGTKSIDLWVLFPLGVGVNRLLIKQRPPERSWADRLTRIFGTDAWRKAFYHESNQGDLFNITPDLIKDADFKTISRYWVNRLQSVFVDVARNPLPLRNSRNVPIYLLSFAAANPRGAKTAVKIAQDILSR
jgi:three-Cys-motif partner protein